MDAPGQLFTGLLQVVLVTGGSFAVLVLLASFFRFQGLTQSDGESDASLTTEDGANALSMLLVKRLASAHLAPKPFGLFLLRLTNGSQVEEKYGAEVLAGCLNTIQTAVNEQVRGSDRMLFFDDRTLAVMVDTEGAHLLTVADRIRTALERVMYRGERGLSVSLPVVMSCARVPEDGTRAATLLDLAETRLVEQVEHPERPLFELPLEEDAASDESQPAILDELTGVLRGKHLGSAMSKFISRRRRDGLPAAIVYLDVDHLDRYNENYGRTSGDAILKGLGAFLQEQLREEDLISRFDGEEFVLMLNCGLEGGQAAVKRLMQNIKRTPFTHGRTKLRISITAGLSAMPEHGQVARKLFQSSRAAMHQAKAHGGALLRVYDDSLPLNLNQRSSSRSELPSDVF